MPTSSIDDLLMGGGLMDAQEPQHNETNEPQHYDEGHQEDYQDSEPDSNDSEPSDLGDEQDSNDSEQKPDYDEYGNEKQRMSKGMQDRLDRKDRKHQAEIEQREQEIQNLRNQLQQQGASREVQKAAKDFEYNENADGDWYQQLTAVIKETVGSMTRDENERHRQQQEHAANREFEARFRNGMNRFDDFVEVVGGFEMTPAMTAGTRGMKDPAAFLYAAAKRNPQDLERIAKLKDPYAQIAEIGRLEERMIRNKPSTKAPRPLSRSNDDAGMPQPKKQDTGSSIEDLIAQHDKKKADRMRGRIGGRR